MTATQKLSKKVQEEENNDEDAVKVKKEKGVKGESKEAQEEDVEEVAIINQSIRFYQTKF
jgi:hypothetical protein